jgi:hypothetical protein
VEGKFTIFIATQNNSHPYHYLPFPEEHIFEKRNYSGNNAPNITNNQGNISK